MVPNLTWRCHGHTLALRVIELGPYDAILGYDYIKTHSLMDRHWANKTITFQEKGTVITFRVYLHHHHKFLLFCLTNSEMDQGKWCLGFCYVGSNYCLLNLPHPLLFKSCWLNIKTFLQTPKLYHHLECMTVRVYWDISRYGRLGSCNPGLPYLGRLLAP